MKTLGVGNTFFDHTLAVSEIPLGLQKNGLVISTIKKDVENTWTEAGGKTPSDWSVGGSCLNVLKTMVRLGQKCLFITRIGNNTYKDLPAYLANKGIVSCITHVAAEAGFVNCFTTPEDDRSMQVYLGPCTELSDLQDSCFESTDHLHLEGYLGFKENLLETSIELIQEHSPQAAISLDLSTKVDDEKFNKKMKDCARKVDYLFGNLQEMQALTKKEEIQAILEEVNAPQTTVIITNGEDGCWVRPKNTLEPIKFKATPIDSNLIKDTTGAGDFFQAGFLYAALRKKNLETCVAMGNLTSSTVIQHEGTDLPEDVLDSMQAAAKKLMGE